MVRGTRTYSGRREGFLGSLVRRLFGLLLIAAAVGYGLAYTPSIPRHALERSYGAPPSKFLQPASGTRIHYRDQGPRDARFTLVLLHGTASSLHTWEGVTRRLAERWRVVTMDLPGHGLTGATAEGRYDRAGMVAAIARLVDHLGLDSFVIGGNSMGGEMAMAYALIHPERVEGLVLIDSAGLALDLRGRHVPIGFRLAAIPLLRPLIARITPRSVVERSVRAVYADPARVTPALVDRYWRLMRMEGSRRALMKRFAILAGEPPLAVEKITAPALVVWGREDHLIPLAVGDELARRLPHADLVVIDDAGHVPQEERPDETARAIADFLDVLRHAKAAREKDRGAGATLTPGEAENRKAGP